ncbi:E3 ubiquitin-protein ligase RNF168 isoform X2 [Octodon degus]|uniref:E3 ubiquitin-protein ligase RNF168 n=1 Tax=Octodon degus TaxID=10160 RepID=A0A6P6DKB1_OCTDE|nr:E3 ubiquitin-protein ligase RNF168 isoform X2 [Octodon degus]
MAVSPDAVPTLSECQCPICMEILVEPVTLPCRHTLCNPCFRATVEKASLYCPFCRRRVSSWTRYHTRRNSLINTELWDLIQKHYPTECKRRASGQESEEIDDAQPIRFLSQPGELRREYEEEISKVQAERRATEEEENKASEEYIQRLLAEEEEEERRQAEKRRSEMEEQLKNDEELARKLSINITVGSNIAKTLVWQDMEAGDMPTLSPQVSLEVQESSAMSLVDSTMPWLCAYDAVQCLEGKIKTKSDNHDEELCVTNHTGPKDKAPSSQTSSTELGDQAWNGGILPHVTQVTEDCTVETENEESGLLLIDDVSKRKHQEPASEAARDPSCSAKRRKMFPRSYTDEETERNFTQKLIDLEHQLFERHKQEEEDRLLALQLQEEEEKQRKPSWQKGYRDQYELRTASTAPSTAPNGLLTRQSAASRQREAAGEHSLKRQMATEEPRPRRGLRDENWQPFKAQPRPSVSERKMPKSSRDHHSVPRNAQSLQPRNSQKSIFEMFPRCTK